MPPSRVLVVGDYRDDILCGRAAGALTCLLRTSASETYVHLADFSVGTLSELAAVLA